MEIEDKYYKKYIKYKIKYLELQQNGGGFIFKNKNKNNIYGDEYNNVKELRELLKKSYKNKSKIIIKIEYYLLNTLINYLMIKDNDNKDVYIDIYKNICYTIINYREYFYFHSSINITNSTIKTIMDNNFKNIKICKEKIINQLNSLSKLSKFNNFKNIINKYYEFIYDCIRFNNFNEFKLNIFEEFKNNSDENIVNIIKQNTLNTIISEIEKVKNINEIIDTTNYQKIIDKLNNIQKLIKLYYLLDLLYTDEKIMLNNCVFIMFKLKLSIARKIPLDDKHLLLGGKRNDLTVRQDINEFLRDLLQIIENTKSINVNYNDIKEQLNKMKIDLNSYIPFPIKKYLGILEIYIDNIYNGNSR